MEVFSSSFILSCFTSSHFRIFLYNKTTLHEYITTSKAKGHTELHQKMFGLKPLHFAKATTYFHFEYTTCYSLKGPTTFEQDYLSNCYYKKLIKQKSNTHNELHQLIDGVKKQQFKIKMPKYEQFLPKYVSRKGLLSLKLKFSFKLLCRLGSKKNLLSSHYK